MWKRLRRALWGSHRSRPELAGGSSFLKRAIRHLWRQQWLHRQINYKLLAILVFGVGTLFVGVHFLHGYQVQRNSGIFKDRAAQAEKDKKPELMEKYLRQYLKMVPDDAESQYKYACLLEDHAKKANIYQHLEKAFLAMERAVKLDPTNKEVRKRAVQLALYIGRYQEAKDHVAILDKDSPNDPVFLYWAGQCAFGLGNDEEGEKLLKISKETQPEQIDAYILLARFYKFKLNKPSQADFELNEMISANSKNVNAFLAKNQFDRAVGNARAIGPNLVEAEKLDPNNPDLLLAQADYALSEGRLGDARDYAKKGLAADPKHVGLYRAAAMVELRADKPADAVKILKEGKDKVDKSDELVPFLVEALLEVNLVKEAEEEITLFRKQPGINVFQLRYLEARVIIQKGQVAEGAQILEQVRPRLTNYAFLIDLMLCRCYAAMGDADRRLEAARRLEKMDALGVTVRIEYASALQAVGQTGDALREYRLVADKSQRARLQAVRLTTHRLLLLPPADRSWKDVETLLGQAETAEPHSPEVVLLRAQVNLLQDKYSEARQVLEAAQKREPKNVDYTLTLAAMTQWKEGTDKALAVLAQFPNDVDVRLTRILYLIPGQPAEAKKLLQGLEKDIVSLPDRERLGLMQGIAGGYLRLNEPTEAERVYQKVAEAQPHNIQLLLRLFDLAWKASNVTGMEKAITRIRTIDGTEGPYTIQCEAALALTQSRKGSDSQALARAQKHIDVASRIRPNWSSLALLQGELKELEKDWDGALAHYRRAISLGEQRPEVVFRAVQLLYSKNQFEEANKLFRSLQDRMVLTGEMGRWAAEVSLRNQDRERALDLARQSVTSGTTDHRQHLWLGQMLVMCGKKEEALKPLLRAVELAPTAPEAVAGLVYYYLTNDQRALAEEEVGKVKGKLPPLAMGACYEMIGRHEDAAKEFLAALEQKPDDVANWRVAISFHQRRGEYNKADPLLRKMQALGNKLSDADVLWVRRQLALGLAMMGEQSKFEEALDLLKTDSKGGEPTLEDQKLRAMVLSLRADRRDEAIKLLEDLHTRKALSNDELYRLVLLHEANKDDAKAENLLKQLVDAPEKNPRHLAHRANQLFLQGKVNEVDQVLADLDKIDPNGFPTLTVRTRLLVAQKQEAQAVDLVKKYVEGKQNAFLGLGATLLEELKQLKPAEEMYRQFVARADLPESGLVLVHFLARQHRLDDALAECEKLWEKCPPERMATTSVGTMRQCKAEAKPEHYKRVDDWLMKARAKNPASASLVLTQADFCELREDYRQAQSLYREVIQKNPKNVIALNNLAWLLTLKDGDAEKAEVYVQAAVAQVGPIPELLDTRAVVYMGLGKAQEAIKDLEKAIAQTANPTRCFHLAQAHLQAGDHKNARIALKKAMALGLDASTLHPLERDKLPKLVEQLK